MMSDRLQVWRAMREDGLGYLSWHKRDLLGVVYFGDPDLFVRIEELIR